MKFYLENFVSVFSINIKRFCLGVLRNARSCIFFPSNEVKMCGHVDYFSYHFSKIKFNEHFFLAFLAVARGRADVPQVVKSSARLCEHANECYAG